MPYAQLDDRYDDHRKVKRAWRRCPAAVGLHAMAITYCNRHKSDGDLEADWVEEKLALLKPRERKVAIDVLVDVGLFERRGEDYYVHDFLQWNRSAKQRDALAEQGRRGGYAKAAAKASEPDGDGSGPGHRNGHSQGSGPGHRNGHSQGSSQGHSPGSGEGSSTPRHATPTVRQEHPVAAAPPPDQTDLAVEELCLLMSQHVRTAHGIDPGSREAKVTKGWRDACKALLTLDGYSREQVAFAIEWVCRHHYWRHRVKSMTRLRSEMGQLVQEIKRQRDGGGQVVPLRRESAGDLIDAMRGAS